jgi:hypothetical protein
MVIEEPALNSTVAPLGIVTPVPMVIEVALQVHVLSAGNDTPLRFTLPPEQFGHGSTLLRSKLTIPNVFSKPYACPE